MSNYRKRMPAEGDFMKKKTNDILYGFLQSISYVDKNKVTFVYKSDVDFLEISRMFDGKFSKKKLISDFKFLQSIGLIELGKTTSLEDNVEREIYVLPDVGEKYKLIPIETLRFLINTTNTNVIKVYVWLLYKFNDGIKKGYKFSKKEIIEDVLKMKARNKRDMILVSDILTCLQNNELIKFHVEWTTAENSVINKTQYHVLDDVSLTFKK